MGQNHFRKHLTHIKFHIARRRQNLTTSKNEPIIISFLQTHYFVLVEQKALQRLSDCFLFERHRVGASDGKQSVFLYKSGRKTLNLKGVNSIWRNAPNIGILLL